MFSILKRGLIFLLAAGFWIAAQAQHFTPEVPVGFSVPAYQVEQVSAGGIIEHRFLYQGRHFATLIDDAGTYALRPHPGCDLNGWGSTWYAQPFFPAAVLQHTSFGSISADPSGIQVEAAGMVSRGASDTYGSWESVMAYTYHPLEKMVRGSGVYTVTLAGQLSESTGDLNLYKIASNYLEDVPLLQGGIGDTGDMSRAEVAGNGFAFDWLPPDQPAHFPSDESSWLSIDVRGEFNQVDTAAMGYAPIAAAFKPSLKVVLTARSENIGMRFGGFYSLAERQNFWSDNVGITPLIVRSSPETMFDFDVLFESEALETCVYIPVIVR